MATPLSMSTVEIKLPPQESVALPPVVMLVGLIVSEQLGVPPPPPPFSVTGAVQLAETPAEFTTVPVNVVLAVIAGDVVEPAATGDTEPTPLFIENAWPFVVVHASVVVAPEFTFVGDAVSVQVGAGGATVTVMVAEHVRVPPGPVAVPV